MSSISALEVPGLASTLSAKPDVGVLARAQTTAAPNAAVAATTPTYPSPTIAIDPLSNHVIIEYRNQTSGDVTQQTPPKEALRLYQQSGSSSVPSGKGSQA
jgi:hypothetical protein